MGKALGYLIVLIFGVFLLRSTGLFDGMFQRSNLEERAKYWEETVARETPNGTSKGVVDALAARNGMSLECFHSSLQPPIADCIADDPGSKGGTSGHPVALQLRFTFHGESLAKFETNPHVLQ